MFAKKQVGAQPQLKHVVSMARCTTDHMIATGG